MAQVNRDWSLTYGDIVPYDPHAPGVPEGARDLSPHQADMCAPIELIDPLNQRLAELAAELATATD